jgi:hypothetical protein
MKTLVTLVIIAAALVIGFAALAATNDVRTGVWTADIKESRVLLSIFPGRSETLDRRWNYNGNIIGFHVPLAKLTGLTGADGDSKFTYRAAAGTIDFDGHFSAAQGAGHFRFTPSDEFVRDMAQLGYTDFKEDSLLIYAVHDLSPSVVRELKAMGYQPSRRELDDVAIFDINPEAIREFARLGYPNLTLRELVNMRVGNVDASYINALRDLGYTNLSAHEISETAILGVKPDYIRELRGAGLKNLTLRELRDLRIGNITAKRIEAYRAAGYSDLTAHQLSEMGIMGVTPEYIKEMNDIGIHDLHKIIEMRTTGAGEILLKKKSR